MQRHPFGVAVEPTEKVSESPPPRHGSGRARLTPFIEGGGAPELIFHPVDLHDDLVEIPAQMREEPDRPGPAATDLGRKSRAEPVPSEPRRLVRDVDVWLVQQVLDAPERWRSADNHIPAWRMITGRVLKWQKMRASLLRSGQPRSRSRQADFPLTGFLRQLHRTPPVR